MNSPLLGAPLCSHVEFRGNSSDRGAHGFHFLFLWVFLSAILTSTAQAETTLTVEEFTAQESKWPSLLDTTLQIEGRYSGFSDSQLRMDRCKLDFVLASSFPRPAGDSKTIIVKGRLEKRDTKLVFVVSDLKPQLSDVEQFRSLRGKVPSNKPEEWFKLAEFGAKRAKFYRDDALKAEATAAFKQGVLAEHRNLNPPTPDALKALALKLSRWNADPALQLEFIHEALRIEFGHILKTSGSGDGELLTAIAKQLPGTDQPLRKEDETVRESYLKSPLLVFKDGDAEQRKKYARAFYAEVMKYRILREAAPDGKNGFDIAFRIESQLPEYQSLAPAYRDKEREYLLERVGSMTRKEMSALVEKYEPLKDPGFLVLIKQRWLLEKEKRIDLKSSRDLVDIGDDYLLIQQDRDSAIRFYKKAYAVSPETQAISDWLKEQGLALHNGNWLAKDAVPQAVEDPLAAAVRAGTVREKMTAEQVRSALGGDPTRRTRIATSGHVQEWWLFEDHGLSVEFTRRRGTEAALVTKVTNLKSKPRPARSAPTKTGKAIGAEGF